MKNNLSGMKFQYSYSKLPSLLFSKAEPTPVSNPEIIIFNDKLAEDLNIAFTDQSVYYLSGNRLEENSQPIAQAYAGHQFGHFTMLGDGRAVLLGEHLVNDTLYDIQLKGSGPTPYSRRGDGRATLSSMLREYIISEAMHALKIPTTRSLSVIKTGDTVYREINHDGAILTRISKAHIRVGTFQYAASKGTEIVKKLTDYTIQRNYPNLKLTDNLYQSFFEAVLDQQAKLIAQWQSVGFIHGVMNTDNMSIVGETMDYGPCAFMDTYNPKTVFSSIDHQGRYAYFNQPNIAHWNLARFAETLVPLFSDSNEEAVMIANKLLADFMPRYLSYWYELMAKKIGLFQILDGDHNLITELLQIMETLKLDYNNTFVQLAEKTDFAEELLQSWYQRWQLRLTDQKETLSESILLMTSVNPYVIPRNHQVELVLEQAVLGEYEPLHELLEVLSHPFKNDVPKKYTLPPSSSVMPYKTYCGT